MSGFSLAPLRRVEAAVRFSDDLRGFPSLPGFVVAEGAAGPLLEVAVQPAVFGKERRSELQPRLRTGLAPELLRPLYPTVEHLHRRLHVAGRPRQALAAV